MSAIIAFLIRFENGPILIGTATIWFGLIKNWKLTSIDLKKTWKQIFILCLIVSSWFLIHLKLNGWLIVSPLFGHEIDRQRAVKDLYHFLFIEQGRWLVSIVTLVLAVFNFKNIKKNKKIISILLLISAPLFVIVWQLGNSLPRYTISILPFYYFIIVVLLPKENNFKTKILSAAIIATVFIYQSSFIYKCSGNRETCLSFTKLISIKKEIGLFLENNIQANSTIYANWDEIEEFSNPSHSLGYFCQNCSQANFNNFQENINDYKKGDYIVSTSNSEHIIMLIKKIRNLRLIKKFEVKGSEAKIYQFI